MVLYLAEYLFRVSPQDQKIINSIARVFEPNRRMQDMIAGSKISHKKGLRFLIAFCFKLVAKKGGIFKAQTAPTYLLWYRQSEHRFTLHDYLRYIWLALIVIGFKKVISTIKREKRIRTIRLKEAAARNDEDFLYIWFLAQHENENSIKGLVEVKHFIQQLKKDNDLPVYIETTEERLLSLYKRAGFKFYHCEHLSKNNIKVWFGRL